MKERERKRGRRTTDSGREGKRGRTVGEREEGKETNPRTERERGREDERVKSCIQSTII